MPHVVEEPQREFVVTARCEACGAAVGHLLCVSRDGDTIVMRAACSACAEVTILEGSDDAAPA